MSRCHLAHCSVQTHLLYIVTLIQLCMVQPHGYRCNRYGDNEYLCCILVSLELLALYTVYNNRMFHSKHTKQQQQQQNPQTAPFSHNYSNTLIQVTQTHMHAACMHARTLTHAGTHACAHTQACMHAHSHTHAGTHAHSHTQACMHTHTHIKYTYIHGSIKDWEQ